MAHTDETVVSFGTYAGLKYEDIPASWFIYMEGRIIPKTIKSRWEKDFLTYVEENRDTLEKEVK